MISGSTDGQKVLHYMVTSGQSASRISFLPTHPLDFIPGEHFTQECTDTLDLDPAKWLWPKELKLICWIVRKHKKGFSWDPVEQG